MEIINLKHNKNSIDNRNLKSKNFGETQMNINVSFTIPRNKLMKFLLRTTIKLLGG